MNKSTKKIVALLLLAAFILWMIFTIFPVGGPGSSPGSVNRKPVTYEPKFQKEGELAFVNPGSGDTIKAITIEIAENPEEIQYGMMYRKNMDPNTGMLFLMGEERPQSFWMKNTYVSLDIIYINSKNEIVSIQKNAQPLSETSLPSEGAASMVLEVKGGFSDQHGIQKGSVIVFERDQ